MSKINYDKTITIKRIDLINACADVLCDIANEMKEPSIVLLGAMLTTEITRKLFDDKPEEVA